METQKTTVKATAIPDKKSLDRFGNPTKWILKVVEPRELYGLIAFPEFEVKPGIYVVDVVKRGKNYAVVRPHQHIWEEVRREEDPYTVKIVFRCRCGAWNVERIEKFGAPLVDDWKSRWYIKHAVELRRRSEEIVKNAPPPRHMYILARDAEAAEKLLTTLRRKSVEEALSEICKEYESTIYDDEEMKWRTIDAWKGAKDKSWICDNYPQLGYVPVLGWVDYASYIQYKTAKNEAEKLWNAAEEILGERVDVGQCIPDGSGGCRRYASRLASFL